jgi:hypothetical protein
MDGYDEEIQGMLKRLKDEPYYYEDLESDKGATEQIASFLAFYAEKQQRPLSDAIGKEILIFGLSFNLKNSHTLAKDEVVLYSEDVVFRGVILDRFSMKMDEILRRYSAPYLNEDETGRFFIFKNGIRITISASGRMLKRYDLKVME